MTWAVTVAGGASQQPKTDRPLASCLLPLPQPRPGVRRALAARGLPLSASFISSVSGTPHTACAVRATRRCLIH